MADTTIFTPAQQAAQQAASRAAQHAAPRAAASRTDSPHDGGKLVVAFICTHNSCRSQIAEALATDYAKRGMTGFDRFTFVSAGTELKNAINPDAQRLLLAHRGIDMAARGQYPKLIADIPHPDIAISMGCGVRCPFIGRPFDDDWGLDDPTGLPDDEFLTAIDAIDRLVRAIPGTYSR